MNQKQDSCRIVANFLTLHSLGFRATNEEYKLMADLLWLCLPMKYRMDKQKILAMQAQVAMQKK